MKNLLSLFKTFAKKQSLILFVSLLLIFILIAVIKNNQTNKHISNLPTPEPTLSPEGIKEAERKQTIEAFLSDLVRFPKNQVEIKPETVKQVFPLVLGNRPSGWLVEIEEVEKESSAISYYLFTPVLVKELKEPIICEADGAYTVGAEPNLGRSLQNKSGYLILYGTKNCGPGADRIAVYSLQAGEKIKLQGDFKIPGMPINGVTKNGNALGNLRGVFGINKPTVVIEYGSFENAANKIEEVSTVAYFDLQTGKLKQLIKFD